MSIYVEYVLLDNLVINSLILLCVKFTLKLRSRWWSILLSSTLGTIFAVCMPLMRLSDVALLPLKLLLGMLMVLLMAKYVSIKDYLLAFVVFVFYTFLLGGACFATLLAFGCNLDTLMAGGYDMAVPLGVVLAIVAFYIYLIMVVAKYVARRRVLDPFIRKVRLYIKDKIIDLTAFIDSGNRLTDSHSGMPVIILCVKALEKHFSPEDIEGLLNYNVTHSTIFKNVHTTNFSTISGRAGSMILFEADKLVINQGGSEYITNKFVVGVTAKKFSDAVNYDMLLSPALF